MNLTIWLALALVLVPGRPGTDALSACLAPHDRDHEPTSG